MATKSANQNVVDERTKTALKRVLDVLRPLTPEQQRRVIEAVKVLLDAPTE